MYPTNTQTFKRLLVPSDLRFPDKDKSRDLSEFGFTRHVYKESTYYIFYGYYEMFVSIAKIA